MIKMMKNKQTYRCVFVVIISLLFWNQNLLSQNNNQKPVLNVERVLRNVADNIMQNTSFKIINTKTGKKYNKSDDIPIESGFKVESPYNEWKYWNGVLNMGFLELGSNLKDQNYIDYARKNVSFSFDHDVFFKKCYGAHFENTGMDQKYRLALLDDCGAMGASVIDVYNIDRQKRYKDYIDDAADYIMNKEKRLRDGSFCRDVPYKMTLWGDDLYMSVPFLAKMGTLTKNQKYFDEAARQVIQFTKYLWDERTGLFYHCWYDDIHQNGVAHWGRCNGWIIMAQIELLKQLPENYPQKGELIRLLNRQITGLIRYQDVSGLWSQLIDKSNTYLETSSSAIFTYSIAKAINEGWLDARYTDVAVQGWEGVASRIMPDGQVKGICAGTGVSAAISYYANRPTPLNDIHGLGPVLLAGSEIMKLYKKGIPSVWGL